MRGLIGIGLALAALTLVTSASAGEVADVSVRYAAPRLTDKPVLVVIHGGGWEGNSTAQTRTTALHLHRMGYPVINAAYRLACYGSDGVLIAACPHLDKLVLDVARQVRWARRNHAAMRTTSRQVILVGQSAGGHLAALLTARGLADGAISFSGPTDLPSVVPYLVENVNGLIGCTYEDCPRKWIAASPTSYPTERPMFLAYGQHEAMVPPREQGDPMRRVAPNAEVVRVPGTGHCCTDHWDWPLMPRALAYIEARLAGARGGRAVGMGSPRSG